jgi:3'(2'), 5'-bisphosphate nucleotidase
MTAICRKNEQAMNATNTTTEFGREIEVASRLAREAGEGILAIYATDFAVHYKAGWDPVTEADRLASRVIVDGLRREFPEDMVVSEEESIDPMRAIPARVWYVDPVDGTREFIKRNGEFAVMIGLAVDGCAQLGVVFRPVTAELFAGIVEQGAWLETERLKAPLQVSSETNPASLRMATSRSHRHGLVDRLVQRLAISKEHRIGSVGIKVGMLVTRQSDVYLEPSGVTKAWDSCAPEAVLRAAGGRMTDLTGTALRYSPHDVRNRQGLVATNGACHETVISAIASVLREHG